MVCDVISNYQLGFSWDLSTPVIRGKDHDGIQRESFHTRPEQGRGAAAIRDRPFHTARNAARTESGRAM